EYGVVSLFGESSRGTISEGTEFGDRINRLVELELVTEALLGVDCVVRGLTDRLRRAGKLE
ncbi:MAG: hypothetical protein QF824_02635, partial [Candidatus Woesearchaeota archaeon]|nr:hypothetical protein [Candidatus Woesearchaeota archaeon]